MAIEVDKVARLAASFIDTLVERYGEDAELADVLLVAEVSVPDEDDPDGGDLEWVRWESLSGRTTAEEGMARRVARAIERKRPIEP